MRLSEPRPRISLNNISMTEKPVGYKIPIDYYIMFGISIILVVFAVFLDTPERIWEGYVKINLSTSALVTDYVALAGIGAALVNSAVMLILNLLMLIYTKRRPCGRIMAALFLTIGFSLFGKNMFNSLPIVAGVWLYGRVSRVKFSGLVVQAMVSTTVAPIVSEVTFGGGGGISLEKIAAAYIIGMFVGFIFPPIMENVRRLYKNYCLYRGGIAGGFIATMFAGLFKSFGFELTPENYWDTSHTMYMAMFAYSVALLMIIYVVIADKPVNSFRQFRKLMKERDPDDCDYVEKYGDICYINIGLMCIVSTTLMLFMGVPVNGPVLGGIFTISGFAAHGKHLKNITPILIGSIAAANLNNMEFVDPMNSLAILFSTGLAPMAGKYGWQWGIVIGFIHVSIAIFIGDINGGLNLYNNGFAGCFSVFVILPLIKFGRRLFIMIKAKSRGHLH